MNCSHEQGGAISLLDISNVTIQDNTSFIGNIAKTKGGAIYFECNNHSENVNQCSLAINDSNFINNTAGVEGGAIKWNIYAPKTNNL